jgi:hypothetical protein
MQQFLGKHINRSKIMSKMFQVYGIGQALIPVLPPPLPFENAPTSNQTNYEIGQLVFTPPTNPTSFFLYGGGGNWVEFATSSGDVTSVTGTANQILASPTSGAVVLSLIGPYTPATYTAHGVLVGEGTSSIVATAAGTTGQVLTATTSADPAFAALGTNSGLTAHGVLLGEGNSAIAATAAGTAGQLLTSGGASADPTWTTATFPATVAAGALLAGTASNVVGPIADVATGQVLMSGGVGVIPAYSGSPSVSGSLTAATTITATLGNITATNGNLAMGTAGNKIIVPTGSNASAGTSGVMSGTPGAVTVATTACSATAKVFYARATAGGTLGNVSITAQDGTGFTLTSTGNETSTFNWWIINA